MRWDAGRVTPEDLALLRRTRDPAAGARVRPLPAKQDGSPGDEVRGRRAARVHGSPAWLRQKFTISRVALKCVATGRLPTVVGVGQLWPPPTTVTYSNAWAPPWNS